MYREMVASDGCSIGENIELLVEKGVLFEKEEGKTLKVPSRTVVLTHVLPNPRIPPGRAML